MNTVIKRLPQYVINKLKAGEIVDRPSSVIKELVENALDAGATNIVIEIKKWWKQLIKISDNGRGMSREDLELSVERYATSKIEQVEDLNSIDSYGFRGEALASISEVSVFRIQSRNADIWHELYRDGTHFHVRPIPFAKEHGTTIYVEDLFHNIPARKKFLKTDTTEWTYIKQISLTYAIIHRDKSRQLIKDGKMLYQYAPAWSLLERLLAITKSDREHNLKEIAYEDEKVSMFGVCGDASLHFSSRQYMWLFVNGRPVQDRLIRKAVMQAYQRQIVPGSYPFVCLFVEIDPSLVDVNVHPRKSEVKFLDPGSMFSRIQSTVYEAVKGSRVNYAAFRKSEVRTSLHEPSPLTPLPKGEGDALLSWWDIIREPSATYTAWPQKKFRQQTKSRLTKQEVEDLKKVGQARREEAMFGVHDVDRVTSAPHLRWTWHDSDRWDISDISLEWQSYMLVGQLRESYILLQSETDLIYIDQHALAERIAFEQMKQHVRETGFTSEVLLTPLKTVPPKSLDPADLENKLEQLSSIGYDISPLWETSLVIYALPTVFANWKIDTELVLNRFWSHETDMSQVSQVFQGVELFDTILDEIVGMKACKASIKAGQKLSPHEMKQLIEDGIDHIDGMFVCQHGRPSVVRVSRGNVDGLFERH